MSELLEEFVRNAEAVGFHVHRAPFTPPEGAGISQASHAIAATGSVVFTASAQEPRAASVLPAVHVSIVRPETIVRDLATLFAELGDDLPSALAVVTGPSASADIGQRHLVGVHGPGEVHVVIDGAAS